MCRVKILSQNNLSDIVNIGEIKLLIFGQSQHALTLGIVQKLAFFVQKFECVPLLGVVRSGDNDTAISLMRNDRHLRTRSSTEANVDNINAATQERTLDDVVYHLARDTRITANNDSQTFSVILLSHKTGISRRKLHNVNRGEVVALPAAYCTSNAGNRFDECHFISL